VVETAGSSLAAEPPASPDVETVEKARAEENEKAGKALVYAASCGSLHVVKQLVEEEGADVNLSDAGTRWWPVLAAAAADQPKILAYLIEAGASLDVAVESNPGLTNCFCTGRLDALYLSVRENGTECVQLLLDAGMKSRHSDADILELAEYNLKKFSARNDDGVNCGDDSDSRLAYDTAAANLQQLQDCFAARARLRAYRRLALSALLNDRLGADSYVANGLDMDVLTSTVQALERYPGPVATAVELQQFDEQGWAWSATSVLRIAPGGFNAGIGTAGSSGGGGGGRAARKGKPRGRRGARSKRKGRK
jgi:hypothetical protein